MGWDWLQWGGERSAGLLDPGLWGGAGAGVLLLAGGYQLAGEDPAEETLLAVPLVSVREEVQVVSLGPPDAWGFGKGARRKVQRGQEGTEVAQLSEMPLPKDAAAIAARYRQDLEREVEALCVAASEPCLDTAAATDDILLDWFKRLSGGPRPYAPHLVRGANENVAYLTRAVRAAEAEARGQYSDRKAQEIHIWQVLRATLRDDNPYLKELVRQLWSSAGWRDAFYRMAIDVVSPGDLPTNLLVPNGLLPRSEIPFDTLEDYLGAGATDGWTPPVAYTFAGKRGGAAAAAYDTIYVSEDRDPEVIAQEYFHHWAFRRHPWLAESQEGAELGELISEGIGFAAVRRLGDPAAVDRAFKRRIKLYLGERISGKTVSATYGRLGDATARSLINQRQSISLNTVDWRWVDLDRFAAWHDTLGRKLVAELPRGESMLKDVGAVLDGHVQYNVPAVEVPYRLILERAFVEQPDVPSTAEMDDLLSGALGVVEQLVPPNQDHFFDWPSNRLRPVDIAIGTRHDRNDQFGTQRVDMDGDGRTETVRVRIRWEDVNRASPDAKWVAMATMLAGELFGPVQQELDPTRTVTSKAKYQAQLTFLARLNRAVDAGELAQGIDRRAVKATINELWDHASERLRAVR